MLTRFLTICLFLSGSVLYAQPSVQELAMIFGRAIDLEASGEGDTHQEALALYDQVIAGYTNVRFPDDTLLALTYLKRGGLLATLQDDQNAIVAYKRALAICEEHFPGDHPVFMECYLYTGESYFRRMQFDSVEYYFNLAEHYAEQRKVQPEMLERLYSDFGIFSLHVGNYSRAVKLIKKSIDLTLKNDLSEDALIANTQNLAYAYSQLGYYHESIEEERKLLSDEAASILPVHYTVGRNYLKLGQYDSAVFYSNQAVRNANSKYQLLGYITLGTASFQQGEVADARDYYLQSLALASEAEGKKNTWLTDAYLGLAKVAGSERNWAEALRYYQQGLINITYDFQDTSMYASPEDYSNMISLPDVFRLLQGKGNAFYQYFLEAGDTSFLEHSLKNFQQAIALGRHIQKSYDSDEAKLFFTAHMNPVFSSALRTVFALYELTGEKRYVTEGLNVAETGKASVLTEMLKEVEIKASGEVNDSLVQDEKRLKQRITALRILLAQSTDSASNVAFQEDILDLEVALGHTIRELQKDERYYQLKYQESGLGVSQIQQEVLDQDQALLEYLFGEKFLYLFLVTQQGIDLKKMPLTEDFQEALTQTHSLLYNFQVGQKGMLHPHSYRLYQTLIQPFAHEIADKKKLVIIPDGQLNFLPFEVLTNRQASESYFIRDHIISYTYTIRLLYDAMQHRGAKIKSNILAMAPYTGNTGTTFRDSDLGLLAFSENEVKQTDGSIYVSQNATKRRFLEMASSYGILHLATHATVNSDDPLNSFIAFYPEELNGSDSLSRHPDSLQSLGTATTIASSGFRLYSRELYHMNLDSVQLVILSACEAGNGTLIKGEGVISLARAFAYAGCPNIMSTLWSADDQSSAIIASSVHHYLKAGYPKDEAMQMAKMDYLENEDIHPALKAPAFWANFIFIGDPAPIYSNYMPYYLFFLGMLLLLMAYFTWRYYQKRREPEYTIAGE